MEKWDLYDINRQKLNKLHTRGNKLNKGEFHLVVHVVILNDKNEMLIQQRQSFKEGFPNLWDVSVGGSAVAGETSQMAAQRETKEEIGINYEFKERPNFTINFSVGFDDYYIINIDGIDTTKLKLQYEEVKAVKWASLEEILNMIDDKEFIPYSKEIIKFIFSMKCRYGTINE